MSTNGAKQFNKTFNTLVFVFVFLCLLLLGLNMRQGPRLRRVEIDRSAVIRQSNERIVFYANQPVSTIEASQVSIEPAVTYSVSTNGEALVLQFEQKLLYDTTYTVNISNVRSLYKNQTATFKHSFTTGKPNVYVLRRNTNDSISGIKKPDQIIQTNLDTNAETIVYESEKIQDYVLFGKQSLVVTVINSADSDGITNELYMVDTTTKKTQKLPLPDAGAVTKLRTSNNERLLGFSFTSVGSRKQYDYHNNLFNIDTAANNLLYTVFGLDKKPAQVMDWQFAPDGTSVLAQTNNTSVILIDTTYKNSPVPVGQYSSVTNFSFNGTKIIANDSEQGYQIVDLLLKTRTNIVNDSIDGIQPFTVKALLKQNGEGLVKLITVLGRDNKTFTQYLYSQTQNESTKIYTNTEQLQQIANYSLSPNDQYISLETYSLEPGNKYDAYPELPMQNGTTTKIISSKDGSVVKSVEGFRVQWQ